MGMRMTAIPYLPWDSHRNGNKISHGMGMGMKCMGMGNKTWECMKKNTADCTVLGRNELHITKLQ